jgi:outer membrane protein assembly factor BamB
MVNTWIFAILITFSSINTKCNLQKPNDHLENVLTLPEELDWISSSIALYDGVVYFGDFKNNLVRISLSNPKPEVCFSGPAQIYFKPIIFENTIIFSMFDNTIRCLDLKDFHEIWSVLLEDRVKNDILISDGSLYVSVRNKGIIAIEAQTGKIKWAFTNYKTELTTSPLTIQGESLFFSDVEGSLFKLTVKNGKPMITKSISGVLFSAMFLKDNRIYVGFDNFYKGGGGLKILDTSLNEIISTPIKFEVNYPPAVTENNIVIGSYDNLIVMFDTLGAKQWELKLSASENLDCEIFISNGKVYFSTTARKFYCLRVSDGSILYSLKLDYGVSHIINYNKKNYLFIGGKWMYLLKD